MIDILAQNYGCYIRQPAHRFSAPILLTGSRSSGRRDRDGFASHTQYPAPCLGCLARGSCSCHRLTRSMPGVTAMAPLAFPARLSNIFMIFRLLPLMFRAVPFAHLLSVFGRFQKSRF